MNILAAKTNSFPSAQSAKPAPRSVPSEPQASRPTESFQFSSHSNIKEGLIFGALGVVPVIGAASNFGAGIQAQFNGHDAAGTAGGVGFLANLAGTATLVGGAIFGNSIAMNIGLGMLGVSGLTAAYAGSV